MAWGARPQQVLPAHWAPFKCSTQVVPLTLISSPVQEGRPGPGWQEVPQPVKVLAFPHQAGERSQVVAGVRGQVSDLENITSGKKAGTAICQKGIATKCPATKASQQNSYYLKHGNSD